MAGKEAQSLSEKIASAETFIDINHLYAAVNALSDEESIPLHNEINTKRQEIVRRIAENLTNKDAEAIKDKLITDRAFMPEEVNQILALVAQSMNKQ